MSLRRDVEGLLAAEDRIASGRDAEKFITNVVSAAALSFAVQAEPSRTGERIGPYRLIRELGHGGMGTVYLGERADEEFQSQVAVKFMRGGLAAPELAHRFRAERQILADLTHPNIAWLLDGGTAADGTPYIVMEYVAGDPIDRWCDARGLGLSGRLALFRSVCAAVQHAHHALVVHRDLKPSNILVTADGTPKLVDFGIAKLLATADDPQATGTLRLMTPAYAAPEQVRGSRITVATDVYALGVLLYRLITGWLPVDLTGATPGEIERRICDELPKTPSAAAREERLEWHRRLRGDLDTIVLKALRKEPERRYASVEQLVEDLRRHDEGLPVRARSDTLAYRATKFVRRHRAGVAVALGAVALTALYTTGVARERDRARLEAARAERVASFLKDLFLVSDPSLARGRVLTARDLLERGAERVTVELRDEPETQAELMAVIGEVFRSLGLYPQAQEQLEAGLAVRRRIGRAADVRTAELFDALSVLRRVAGDYAAAESLGIQAVALRHRLGTTDDTAYANSVSNLAEAKRVRGAVAAAESLYRQSLALRRRLLPPGHRDVADNLNNLALVLHDFGNYAEAVRMHREALALRRGFGDDHPDVSNSLNNVATSLAALGDYAAAESLFSQALALRRRTLGIDEPRTLNTQQNLGGVLVERGEPARARALLAGALTLMRRRLAPDHPYACAATTKLALAMSGLGARDSAVRFARQAVDMYERRLGPDHPATLIAMANLGRVLDAAGDHAGAETWLRRALAGQQRMLPADHPEIGRTAAALAKASS
jgi:serine/threonine-protein kinase